MANCLQTATYRSDVCKEPCDLSSTDGLAHMKPFKLALRSAGHDNSEVHFTDEFRFNLLTDTR